MTCFSLINSIALLAVYTHVQMSQLAWILKVNVQSSDILEIQNLFDVNETTVSQCLSLLSDL